MNTTELEKKFKVAFDIQKKFDEGIPYTLDISGRKLQVYITDLYIDDEFYYSDDFNIQEKCDLSKWLVREFDIQFRDFLDFNEMKDFLDMKLQKDYEKFLKTFENFEEKRLFFDIFWESSHKSLKNYEKHFKKFLKMWEKNEKEEARKKELRENMILIGGRYYTRKEVEEALKTSA